MHTYIICTLAVSICLFYRKVSHSYISSVTALVSRATLRGALTHKKRNPFSFSWTNNAVGRLLPTTSDHAAYDKWKFIFTTNVNEIICVEENCVTFIELSLEILLRFYFVVRKCVVGTSSASENIHRHICATPHLCTVHCRGSSAKGVILSSWGSCS